MKQNEINSPSFLSQSEMDMLELLGLSKADVQEIHLIGSTGQYFLELKLVPDYPPCPNCACKTPKIAAYVLKRIKHSVLATAGCTLLFHQRRYKCPICGRTYYENNPFVFKKQKISQTTVIKILQDLKDFNETYSSVARRYNVSPTTVQNIFDAHVSYSQRALSPIILIDEVYAFRSKSEQYGMSAYVCMLMDFEKQKPIELLQSRKKEYLIDYFKKIPLKEREKVKIVCSDMWDTYRDVAKKMLPQAIVVCDHFHVSKELTAQIKTVRIRIMKGVHEKDEEAYYLLKKFNWMLTSRRAEEDKDGNNIFNPLRTGKYNKKLKQTLNLYEIRERLLDINPVLRTIHNLWCEYTDFYDNCTYETAPDALHKLIGTFRDSDIPEMVHFSQTLGHWSKEILNSFLTVQIRYDVDKETGLVSVNKIRVSNALIENKNAVIKACKKNSCGFRNWKRFRNRMLYVLDKDASIRFEPIDGKQSDDDLRKAQPL